MKEASVKGNVIDIKEVMEKRKGTISCCIITRDEEVFIADAVKSVMELVDEVIVVDTGSVDRTKEVAAEAGARVYKIDWNNDFSAARNSAIDRATKEWILILDADEVISKDDHEKIRALIADYPNGAFLFNQWTYTNASSTFGWNPVPQGSKMSRGALGYFENQQVRLFPNRRTIRYSGEVHENVEKSLFEENVPIYRTDVVVHHYGRLKESDRVFRKSVLYLELGQKKLETDPNNTKYIYEIATQLLDLGRVDDAIKHAREGLKVQPDNWELWNILGLAYLRIGMKEEAEDAFARAIERAPAIADLYNNMGVALMERGDPANALEYFKNGIVVSKGKNANLLRNAAAASLALDDTDEALRYITESIRLDPFMPQSHVIHADILFNSNDFEGASRELTKIKFLPDTPLKVYLKALQLLVKMKMFDEAEKIVLTAIDIYPDQFDLRYLYGKVLENKGAADEALSIYQRCLAEQPDNVDILNSVGCILEKRNELDAALSYFTKAFDLQPFNSKIEANMGIVLDRLGRGEEAERHLRSALVGDPASPSAHNALGCHLANEERYNEAIVHFTRAVELDPANADYYRNLGLACEKLNLFGQAAEIYKRMAMIDESAIPFARTRLNFLKEHV